MATDTTKIGAGWGVDTRGIAPLITALRKASPQLVRELRGELRSVGEIAAEEARSIASQYSTSIPPTIRTRVYRATISVEAGRGDVPLAGLYELGNKGSHGDGDTFRHPVFGNRTNWAEQDRHPFLRPAVERQYPKIEAETLKIADHVVQTIAGRF